MIERAAPIGDAIDSDLSVEEPVVNLLAQTGIRIGNQYALTR